MAGRRGRRVPVAVEAQVAMQLQEGTRARTGGGGGSCRRAAPPPLPPLHSLPSRSPRTWYSGSTVASCHVHAEHGPPALWLATHAAWQGSHDEKVPASATALVPTGGAGGRQSSCRRNYCDPLSLSPPPHTHTSRLPPQPPAPLHPQPGLSALVLG